MEFRLATIADIPEIIRLRILFLKEIAPEKEDLDEAKISDALEKYLKEHLNKDFKNIFAMEGSYIIATGGICFHDYPPTFDHLNATRAYIMNVYTVTSYRNKGIGTKIFEKLLTEAKRKKVDHVSLHANEMGKSIYEKYGFLANQKEIILSLLTTATIQNINPVTFIP
jgi:predicted acetyltransferase